MYGYPSSVGGDWCMKLYYCKYDVIQRGSGFSCCGGWQTADMAAIFRIKWKKNPETGSLDEGQEEAID